VLRALGAKAGSEVSLVPEIDTQKVRQFVGALDKRVSVAATDAELSGLKGLRPQFTKERTGVPLLRGLTAQRIVRAAPVAGDPPNPGGRQDGAARANGCALRPG